MKVLVILDIDPDIVINCHTDGDKEKIKNVSLEDAIEGELGWVKDSGMNPIKIVCSDGLEPNDSDLGKQVRNLLIDE